ncbi:SdiA-regulated domain-containing protein [Fibrella forsythiae]|uniref:SdiA-regulated domain-containing protein n=1 Tax=Fibrella forsythiae TaxID=2817061 RepID=A0ABS3JTK8_9BACT|nr:SdiA-regulated domain-containing protein [Fibrella forsythiae]MBO0952232.1 SdiA-regulated domain-containing protein [Fibrella forsythiae]
MKHLPLILLLASLSACQPGQKKQDETAAQSVVNAPLPYDLANPTQRHKLPDDLREISGLSYYKPGRLACVQDELGVVFIYDLGKKAIADEHILGKNGDYEGVEYVGKKLYVLRSDGELYEMEPTDGIKIIGGSPQTRHIKIDLPGKNDMEGLGYDPQLEALLLATKDGKGTDKIIYFYSLKTKALFQGIVLKQADLQAFDPSINEFKPSGIAVHPKTREYYILSSAAHRLAVVAPNGKVKSLVPIDDKALPQPEGICFAPDGTLYISSEGDGKKGIILAFNAN